MNDIELLNMLKDILENKNVKIDVKKFKSFTDFKVNNKTSKITGCSKIKNDNSNYDKKNVEQAIKEILNITN